MKLTVLPLVLLPFLAAQAQFDETLHAAGLLGSHFGIPGAPASHDYLVIGGGTAGLTMARRLSQDARFTVAVVEAGDFLEFANGNYSQIPGMATIFGGTDPKIKNSLVDWQQWTTEQVGLAGRRIFYPSGKVLGGNSARNYMWYHRASTAALKKWAKLTGDDGYLFENMLPFYKKSTEFTPPSSKHRLENATTLYDTNDFSKAGGPVQVGYPHWANPVSTWVARGYEALGLKNLPGFNNGNINGYTYTAYTIDARTQTRSSSASSFLAEALRKSTNMIVYKNTMAKKIIFDEDKRATGVIVESGGVRYTLHASKEVILSAGAIRSPQLLMASGVGPAKTLQKLGIPVLSDLGGVGQNMRDHISFSQSYIVNVITHNAMVIPEFAAQQAKDYETSRTGVLTNIGGDLLGFARFPEGAVSSTLRKQLDEYSSDWPDYEHLCADGYHGDAKDMTYVPPGGQNFATSQIALANPFSRGSVTINSSDTSDNPIVNPNWLSDPRDQEAAVAAFKRARAVFTSDAVKDVVIGEEFVPGLDVDSDEDVLEHIRQTAIQIFHAACTCAMGKEGDKMAVLDSKARVFGVRGLRVVDASSFPVLPPGHPMATVYAFAEKIAHEILQSPDDSSADGGLEDGSIPHEEL